MSYTNGIGTSQNPFVAETDVASGPAATERAAPISASTSDASGAAGTNTIDNAKVSGFSGALAQALTQNDVRMDKVSAVQQAIFSGTYNVSASAVADKIIHSLLL